jgi:hypothetical protein
VWQPGKQYLHDERDNYDRLAQLWYAFCLLIPGLPYSPAITSTMSHPEIFVQTSNLAPGGCDNGGGGGAGGGDTPIEPLISSADLSNRLHIDTSKIKENEDASPTSSEDSAGNGTDSSGEGQQGLTQDSLNIVLLKRPVAEIPKLKVCLRHTPIHSGGVVCSTGAAANQRSQQLSQVF